MTQHESLRNGETRFPILAVWTLVALLVLGSMLGLPALAEDESPGSIFAAICVVVATAVVFVRWEWVARRGDDPGSARGFLVATVFGAVFSLAVDHEWTTLPLALAALMLSLRRRTAVVVIPGSLLAIFVFVGLSYRWTGAAAMTIVSLGIAVVLFGFMRLSVVIQDLQRTREELARTRVDEERLRIQRDLHDMLGRTLVAASMRNQVAIRTLAKGPDVTRNHLEQLHKVITDGQARLRALTSGPVIASLSDEIDSARTLCERIGIRFDVETVPVERGVAEQYCGAVLRESVTNLLKHSSARHCWVRVVEEDGMLVATVENDGVGARPAAASVGASLGASASGGEALGAGTGLVHLRQSAQQLGGDLVGEHRPDHHFRVTARIPLTATPAPAPTKTLEMT